MAGRHPKPTVVKMLEGNPGKRALNMNEPVCTDPPVMPQHIFEDALAAEKWDEVLAAMPPGVYARLDVAMLAQYAQAYAMMIRAGEQIREEGFTAATAEGVKTHPAVTVWLGMSQTVARCASQLGLVPTARSKLNVPTGGDKKSRLAGLIKSQ